MPDHILAIDQGTTSTRAILFDAALKPVASAQQEFQQHFPHPCSSMLLATFAASITTGASDHVRLPS